MQAFYQMPFEPFERYSPYGTPEHVAEFLSPYVDAGCSAFNVIPCAGDADERDRRGRRASNPPHIVARTLLLLCRDYRGRIDSLTELGDYGADVAQAGEYAVRYAA